MTSPTTYEPSGADRPDPCVIVAPGAEDELHAVAMRALASADGWYQRGGAIVAAAADDKGRPTITPVSSARFRTRLCGLLRWQKRQYDRSSKEWVEVDIPAPKEVADSAYSAGAWPALAPLVGLRDTPILRPDGTLWQTPGYDAASRCLYVPAMAFPPVPARPSRDDAAEALARLQDLFCDLVYDRREQVAVPLSAMLALVGRDAIQGPVPAHLFTAPQPGTGKGLQLEVISQAGLGHRMVPFHLPMPREDDYAAGDREEEQEKRFLGAARDGARALMIDNVRNGSTFGGPVVDRYLTASGEVQGRVLSQTGNPMYPWFAVLCIAGNHVHVANDTRRRTIEAKLVPTCAKPGLRDQDAFRYPLAHGYVLEHRGPIVADLLTVLVAHAQAGRPREKRPDVANFEAWQRTIADAMVWAGGHDPASCLLTDDDGLSGDDALIAAFMRVLVRMGAHAGGPLDRPAAAGASATEVIDVVWTAEWLEAIKDNRPTIGEWPSTIEAREAFTAAWRLPNSKRPAAKSLGMRLGDLCGRVLAGADVWPADDPSGYQAKEVRVAMSIDRNKSPRYLVVPPRGA